MRTMPVASLSAIYPLGQFNVIQSEGTRTFCNRPLRHRQLATRISCFSCCQRPASEAAKKKHRDARRAAVFSTGYCGAMMAVITLPLFFGIARLLDGRLHPIFQTDGLQILQRLFDLSLRRDFLELPCRQLPGFF